MKITKEGRRTYFQFPYNLDLVSKFKSLGAKWEPDSKRWWAANNNVNLEEMKAEFMEVYNVVKDEPVYDEGKDFAFRFDYSAEYKGKPIRLIMREMGAKWDAKNKQWIANDSNPNFTKLKEAYDSIDTEPEMTEEEVAERKRRLAIGYVQFKRIPQVAVVKIKENGGIFDGKGWLMPTLELRNAMDLVVMEIMTAEEDARQIKKLGFNPKDYERIFQWSMHRNPGNQVGDIISLSREIKSLGLVKGDKVTIKGVESSWFNDEVSSFGGPPDWDKGWCHTYYIELVKVY